MVGQLYKTQTNTNIYKNNNKNKKNNVVHKFEFITYLF